MNKHKFNENDKKKYKKYAEKFAPKSNLLKDCVAAGCCLGGKEVRGENTVQLVSRRRDEEESD